MSILNNLIEGSYHLLTLGVIFIVIFLFIFGVRQMHLSDEKVDTQIDKTEEGVVDSFNIFRFLLNIGSIIALLAGIIYGFFFCKNRIKRD